MANKVKITIRYLHKGKYSMVRKRSITIAPVFTLTNTGIKINSYLGSIARHASVVTKRRLMRSSLRRAEQFAQKLAIAKVNQ